MITDTLRPPPLFDPSAVAYKDWLHLNVFDHASGSIALFNVSLHGSPLDRTSRAVGTALVHRPGPGWIGNVEIGGIVDAHVGTSSIGLERVGVGTDPQSGEVFASATFPREEFRARITATPVSAPVRVEQRLAFGSGWISWFVVPRLLVNGELGLGDSVTALVGATAYHDHNWGRWHWGEDVGWEWGTCASVEPECSFVVSRVTNRDHSVTSGTKLLADVGGERRVFAEGAVQMTMQGRLSTPLRRLPGSLAALHQDRVAPVLPSHIDVRASDGVDSVHLAIETHAAAQLIAGDPVSRGYGFINQMAGEFIGRTLIGGRSHTSRGLAIFEYVV